ncbi:hypothetical protein FRC16_007482 [Serendipita sp. 398]|nr:hypothetical protein FRC16_007482 [Serendipita sp. 398]
MNKAKGQCIAYLDNGKSISQLEILCNLMYRAQQQGLSGCPSDCFDIIVSCGMSTIINILLTVLKFPADAAALYYQEIYRRVYRSPRLNAEERTRELRGCLESILTERGLPIDTKLEKSTKQGECFGSFPVFCVTTSKAVVWTTSNPVDTTPKDLTIVDAIMASCAIPNHFLPVVIDGSEYVESGPITERDVCAILSMVLFDDQSVASLTRFGSDPALAPIVPSNPLERSWQKTLTQIVDAATTLGRQLDMMFQYSGFYFHFFLPPSETTSITDENAERLVQQTSDYLNGPLVNAALDDCLRTLRMRKGIIATRHIIGSWGQGGSLDAFPFNDAPFVMRPDLWELMTESIDNDEEGTRVTVLSGPPGSGKSALAMEFLRMRRKRLDFMFYLDASSVTTLTAGLIEAASLFGEFFVQPSLEEAVECFRASHKNWYLLYDDANDTTFRLDNLIPRSDRGVVIITTQNEVLKDLASHQGSHIVVDLMTDYDGAGAFRLVSKARATEELWEQAPLLVSELHPLPITLSLSAAFISQTGCFPDEYRRRHKESLLGLSDSNDVDRDLVMAEAAFNLTFKHLPANARNLLAIFSFVHWSKFPLASVFVAAESGFCGEVFEFQERTTEFYQAIDILQSIFCDQGTWSFGNTLDIIETLKNYSLISLTPTASTILVRIQPLIQQWTREALDESLHQIYQQAAVRLVASSINHHAMRRWLVPHIDALISYVPSCPLHTNDSASFGNIFKQMGRMTTAATLWRAVYRDLVDQYGEGHPHVATACIELAACLPDDQNLTGISSIQDPEVHESPVEAAHPDTIIGQDLQEELLYHFSLADEETLLNGSLQRFRQILDMVTLESEGGLKILPRAQPLAYDPNHAEDLWSCYEYMKSISGETHPDTIHALIHVGWEQQRHGRYEEAAGHFDRALSTIKEKFDSSHAIVTHLLLELGFARCMNDQSVDDRGTLLHQYAEALRQQKYDTTFLVIISLIRLATIHAMERRLDLVEEMLVQARKDLEVYYVPFHSSFHTVTLLLATVRYLRDPKVDSDDLLIQALKGFQHIFGDYPATTREAMMALATVRDFQGRHDENEELWRQILKGRTEELGDVHEETIFALNHLASLYCQQKKYGSAYEIQTELLLAVQRTCGDKHADYAAVMVRIGWTYLHLGMIEDAENIARSAKEILDGAKGTHASAYESVTELLKLSGQKSAPMIKVGPPEEIPVPPVQQSENQVVVRQPFVERRLGKWETIEIKAQMGIHKFWELIQ